MRGGLKDDIQVQFEEPKGFPVGRVAGIHRHRENDRKHCTPIPQNSTGKPAEILMHIGQLGLLVAVGCGDGRENLIVVGEREGVGNDLVTLETGQLVNHCCLTVVIVFRSGNEPQAVTHRSRQRKAIWPNGGDAILRSSGNNPDVFAGIIQLGGFVGVNAWTGEILDDLVGCENQYYIVVRWLRHGEN